MYVKNNIHNQIKVHNNLEIFLREIDKNPLICLLIYEMFKDNKRFLTLNVTKILRSIMIQAEEASLQSSKKALYLKLLEVFCKFEDKLVRVNQQEIVVNFTKDVSKNNLIFLFSNEGLHVLQKYILSCMPPSYIENGTPIMVEPEVNEENREVHMIIETFNVMICINLLSLCCEGKSDLAEIKCQNEILNI